MPVPMDEFPLHQHPVSFAQVGTSDRNFYDRSYFNGHDRTGEIFFISGYGAYPNLGVKDAYFTIRIGDKSFTVRASDALDDDRLEQAGRLLQARGHRAAERHPADRRPATSTGIGFDLTWRGSFPAVDEPRHVILQGGARPIVDAQRFAQVGTWEGEIRVDGRVIEVNPDTWVGSRDRSWGIRPVGEGEPAGRFAAEQGGDYGMFWLYVADPLRRLRDRDHRAGGRRRPPHPQRGEPDLARRLRPQARAARLAAVRDQLQVGHPHPGAPRSCT